MEQKYRKKIQIIMNDAARWITGWGRRTSGAKLMKICKWMNVDELTELHSLTTMWKIVRLSKPRCLNRKVSIDENDVLITNEPRLRNTAINFRHRTVKQWNEMPARIRGIKSLPRFKTNVKKMDSFRKDPETQTNELIRHIN